MSYEYKFSIIMAIYNTENYLKEAINSVVYQTLDFKDNVQLILVNDGSIDNSYNIAYEYQKKFPKNIMVLNQENQGSGSARNLGLKYAEGKYINFLDSDDYLSQNALYNIYEFFEEYGDIVDVVSIPIQCFERENDIYELDYEANSEILDLVENPNNPILSTSACFFKHSAINDLKFNINLICSEGTLFVNEVLVEKKKIGIVSESTYYFRKRNNLTALTDISVFKKEFFTDRLKNFHIALLDYCMNLNMEIPGFIHYTLAYDLQKIIEQKELDASYNEEEIDEFWCCFNHVLQFISDKTIINNEKINDSIKLPFYSLKKGVHVDFENLLLKVDNKVVDSLFNHAIEINKIKVDDTLKISGFLNSYFNNNMVSIDAVKQLDDGTVEYINSRYTGSNKTSDNFISGYSEFNYNFDLTIPINSNEKTMIRIRVNYHKDGDVNNCSNDNLVSAFLQIKFSDICILSNSNHFIENSKIVLFDDNEFSVDEYSTSFNFSVVMAVYNTGNYLEQAVNSVINQTIGFEDNIQLILVDDGSTDNSYDIALKYHEKYPDNVLVLSQENNGQASARNHGLKYVQGKYVNFLDSDDYLSENTFEEVYNFFEKNHDIIDMVAIPIKFFGRKNDDHPLNAKFGSTRVINLNKSPNNPQLSASSAFFKHDVFYEFDFPTNVSFSEDSILINKLLLNKKKYGVVRNACYYYRKRPDLTSTIDTVSSQKEYFTDKLKYYYLELIDYSLNKEDDVPEFIQYLMAYDIQWMLKQPDLSLFENDLEIREFWYYLETVLKFIENKTIMKNRYITNHNFVSFFYALKNKKAHIHVTDDDVLFKIGTHQLSRLGNHKLWFDIVEIRDGYFNVSGLLNSPFNSKYISMEGFRRNNEEIKIFEGKKVEYVDREDVTYLSKTWQYKYNFEVKVPLDKPGITSIKIRVTYHKDGNIHNFNENNIIKFFLQADFLPRTKISNTSNYFINGSNMLVFQENIFNVVPYTYPRLVKNELKCMKKVFNTKNYGYKCAILLRFMYMLLYPIMRTKQIYLFMDRIEQADDNGEHLFKYAVKQKDGIKKYFTVEKESKDYSRLSKIGKTIPYKSIRHKLLYLFTDKVISAHPDESVLNPFFSYDNKKDERELYSGLINSKIYFLQHGVTKDNISDYLKKYDKNLSLITTVSDLEHDSFLEKGYNYDENIIQVLGFPRYDNLKDEHKKEILIIPTWRNYLEGNKGLFTSSDYFKHLNHLINNQELINMVEEKGYKIVFRPHPRLNNKINNTRDEKYIDLFNIDKRIKLSTKESYQDLFRDASLLITDYSSVFFDFAYLKKPLIYYHYSNDYHREESYFKYDTMGFGEVIKEEQELINKIKNYIDNDCIMEDEYTRRVDSFFKYHDKNNCKRNYDWIKEN